MVSEVTFSGDKRLDSAKAALPDGCLQHCSQATVTAAGKPRGHSRSKRVYWSDGSIWRIPETVADEFGIEKFREFTAGRRMELWAASQRERAKQSALAMLAVRDHTAFEIGRKLFGKGFVKDAAEFAIFEVKKLGLVCEAEYAKKYAASRLAKPGKGEKAVKNELLRKGIPSNIADEAIKEAASPESQLESALNWLDRKGKKYTARLTDEYEAKEKNKLSAALYRRGYSGEIIRSVLLRIDSQV